MFCNHCGKELGSADIFCRNCGKRIAPYSHQVHRHPKLREPKEKLVYELAYCGFGFWIPLIMGDNK